MDEPESVSDKASASNPTPVSETPMRIERTEPVKPEIRTESRESVGITTSRGKREWVPSKDR